MSGKSINFDDKKISKSNFYKKKKLFNLNDIEFDKILISKKESYGTKNLLKYFIGYNDDDVIIPLCVNLPQRLVMLNTLIVVRQCLLRLVIIKKWLKKMLHVNTYH